MHGMIHNQSNMKHIGNLMSAGQCNRTDTLSVSSPSYARFLCAAMKIHNTRNNINTQTCESIFRRTTHLHTQERVLRVRHDLFYPHSSDLLAESEHSIACEECSINWRPHTLVPQSRTDGVEICGSVNCRVSYMRDE